jgi:hypothetical protein
MAGKLEKALYGPSMLEVILGAILGFIAGILVAAIYLVFKPVTVVKEMPKEAARGVVYYIAGLEGKARSAAWKDKEKLFQSGKTVQLVEEELNAWAENVTLPTQAPVAPPKPAKPATPAAKADKPPAAPTGPEPDGYIIPGKPNFRIVGDKLQMSTKCTLNWYGLMTDVTVQTTGVFRRDGDFLVFSPETVYLGSCPLHFLPVVGGALVSHIEDKEKVSDEFRAAWQKLNDAPIAGTSLKLVASQ